MQGLVGEFEPFTINFLLIYALFMEKFEVAVIIVNV